MGPGHRSPTQHVKPPVSHPAVSSKRQSRQDLAPAKAGERISDWSENDWHVPQKREEGKGWLHFSEVSQRNSYTGKSGSKQD